jgi:5S rRNA maturation endonuclease (ribonuclease M5)
VKLAKHLGVFKELTPEDWWDADTEEWVTPLDTTDFTDEKWNTLYQEGRLPPGSDGKKKVRVRRADPAKKLGWSYSLGDVRRVPLFLPEALQTAQEGGTVYVVEGTSDAKRLRRLGLTVTTNVNGSGAPWLDEYTEALRGAGTVVILPDNDTPGYTHAYNVYTKLKEGLGSETRIVIIGEDEQPIKSDISDWLDNGTTTIEALNEKIETVWQSGSVTSSKMVHEFVFNPILTPYVETLRTAQAGGTIFVVRNKANTNRLVSMGLTATTNNNDSGTWRTEHSEALKGAGTVVIIADNDEAGYQHAFQAYDKTTKTLGLATRVLIIGRPDQPERSTLKQWLDDGIVTGESLKRDVEEMVKGGMVTNSDEVHDLVFNRAHTAKPEQPTLTEQPRPTDTPVVPVDISGIKLNSMPEIEMPQAWDYPCWLDEYIKFSKEWSPRSWDGFHEDCGLWLMSTVAARRVSYDMGKRRFTSLYIALAARSSYWAKSTATEVATDVLDKAGLSFFRVPDEVTPQAFIRHLTRFVPPDWNTLDNAKKEEIKRRLAFAAQVSWFYEEFGQKLDAMMRQNGVHADFRGILRRFDDHADRYESTTITRGIEDVDKPYLSLLANMTPADLKPYAAKGSPLWQDGFFARFGFSVPDEGAERSDARFPSGHRTIPDSLLKPLVTFHRHLGIPEIDITEKLNEKGEGTGSYRIEAEPLPQVVYHIDPEVEDAYYRYHDGLLDITAKMGNNTDFDSSYARFAEKAMRIATLLASFDDANISGRVEDPNSELANLIKTVRPHHWWRAVLVTERWRRGLHTLAEQLQGDIEYELESNNERRIVSLLKAAKGPVRERDVSRELGIASKMVKETLIRLKEQGIVENKKVKNSRGRPSVLWQID